MIFLIEFGHINFSEYLCARFAKMACQGVLVFIGWLRSYPSEPDADNADVGMDSRSNHNF